MEFNHGASALFIFIFLKAFLEMTNVRILYLILNIVTLMFFNHLTFI